MKHRKDKNGSVDVNELICILVLIAILSFGFYAFLRLIRKENASFEAVEAEAHNYADENKLPIYTKITRIRGCQYLETGFGNAFTRTHMGDCDNPIHPYNVVPKPQLER